MMKIRGYKSKKSNKQKVVSATGSGISEIKIVIFISMFLFSFGFGLITDGKKVYLQQLKFSQRVDYKATLNPYPSN